MALPNETERKLITQLKSSSKDFLKDVDSDLSDMYLIRWIRARNYDMKRSELMLRESKRWRKQNHVDKILDSGLDTFFKVNYPLHLGVQDKRNRPVVILPLGSWNLKAAVKNGLTNRFKTYVIQCVEAIMKTIENKDATRKPCAMPITQFTAVVDFNGFKLSQLFDLKVLRTTQQILSMLETNYPETLANCLCINCPVPISSTFHLLLKQVMPAKTKSKVQWGGTAVNNDGQELLLKFISEEEVQIFDRILDRNQS